MLYILIALLSILIILFFTANFLFNIAINSKKDKTAILSSEHNQLETSDLRTKLLNESEIWFTSANKTDIYINSFDNLKLHGVEILNENKTNEWIIISHGYFGNIAQITSGAQTFYKLGYNLLLLDARSCGNSEGNYIGMGYYDSKDLANWIKFLDKRYSDIKIVLFGVSMGAATVMIASSLNLSTNVKAIIEDCGYTSAADEFSYQAKILYKIPSFPLINIVSLLTKIRAGYWLGNVSPIKNVSESKLPILFIHGDKDTFVPPFMVNKLYNSATCKKKKLIIKGAGHGASYWVDSKLYWGTIKAFIDENIKEQ